VYRCAGELSRRECGSPLRRRARRRVRPWHDGGHGRRARVAQGTGEYALTLGAAEILGIADRVGSIEPGKQADLIVTTGSPAQTVTVVTHEFIDGRPIDLTSMQTENYEKFRNRPMPRLAPPRTDLKGRRAESRQVAAVGA